MELIYKKDGSGGHQSHEAHLYISIESLFVEVCLTGYGCDKKDAFKELKGQFAEFKGTIDKAASLFEADEVLAELIQEKMEVAGILEQVESVDRQTLTGEPDEWIEVKSPYGSEFHLWQNKRNPAVFKDLGGAWFLSAIQWLEKGTVTPFSGTVQGVSSVKAIHKFPFTPKVLLVEVEKEDDSLDFTPTGNQAVLDAIPTAIASQGLWSMV
jgi:hypothetical protein